MKRAWFPKDKEGGIFNLGGQWGKAKCQRENLWNSQLPFLSHSPNHLILPKMVEFVSAWGWGRVWQLEIRIEKVIRFWKTFFWLVGQVNAWEGMPKPLLTHYFHFPHPFSFTWGFLHASKLLVCSSFTLESFSSYLNAHKFVLVLFSKWARKIYIFPTFSWILQWLGTVFTLLSGQEARFTFVLGFIAVVSAPVLP